MYQRKKTKPKKAERLRRRRNRAKALLAAASMLVGTESAAFAQKAAEKPILRLQYSYYQDRQSDGERIEVNAPQLWFLAPLDDDLQLEGGFVFDSVTGASPWYLDTLSGASISDARSAGDLKLTKFFDEYSIGAGISFSNEEDYTSKAGFIESQLWSDDKNTTLTLGLSFSDDDISASNNPNIDESLNSYGGIIGITQVINKYSVIQSNLTFQFSDGYLNDPYKLLDNRPGSRQEFALLTRYVRYITSQNASLHLDYRLYFDSWGILSHMFESSWYQELGEEWLLRPRLRFYTQSAADFYRDEFPPSEEGHYTADHRLSSFGSVTVGLKLIRDFGEGWSASVAVDYTRQDPSWAIFSAGSSAWQDLREIVFSLGIVKEF